MVMSLATLANNVTLLAHLVLDLLALIVLLAVAATYSQEPHAIQDALQVTTSTTVNAMPAKPIVTNAKITQPA